MKDKLAICVNEKCGKEFFQSSAPSMKDRIRNKCCSSLCYEEIKKPLLLVCKNEKCKKIFHPHKRPKDTQGKFCSIECWYDHNYSHRNKMDNEGNICERKCSKCKLFLPIENFSNTGKEKDGEKTKQSICKKCISLKSYTRRYPNIEADLIIFLKSGNAFCESCKETDDLHIDHCHISGKIRGILCGACNRSLGLVKENAQTLRNLANYIEKFQ